MASNRFKPKYIRKYDFKNYFLRSKDQWFYDEQYLKDILDPHYIEEQEEQEEEQHVDGSEQLSLLKETCVTDDDILKILSQYARDNPTLYDSIKFQEACVNHITHIYHLPVYNYDIIFNKRSAEDKYKNTLVYLKKDNFVLINPTFIYRGIALAIPNALIKQNGVYTLIHFVGSTTPKATTWIDLIYLVKIINYALLTNNETLSHIKLCSVRYQKNAKKNISLSLTDTLSLLKSGSQMAKPKDKEESNKFDDTFIEEKEKKHKSGISIEQALLIDKSFRFTDAKVAEKYEDELVPLLSSHQFDMILEELHNFEVNDQLPSFIPEYEKWSRFWGNNSLNGSMWAYYFNRQDKFLPMSFSGHIIRSLKAQDIFRKFGNLNINDFVDEAKIDQSFKDNFTNENYYVDRECAINKKATCSKFKELKHKKVYFDFESLQSCFSVFDDATPFTQIVTQVSYYKSPSKESEDLLFDPLNIDSHIFKKIVDVLYEGEDYSYIVFNKSFEKTRLLEMKEYINESIYSEKIETIVNNMFDLADFFDPRKKLINIKYLHGKYSIKWLVKYLEDNYKDLMRQSGCLSYDEFTNIKNGSKATMATLRRFWQTISSDEWNGELSDQLKAYCHNDVMAMVAVENFVKLLINRFVNI